MQRKAGPSFPAAGVLGTIRFIWAVGGAVIGLTLLCSVATVWTLHYEAIEQQRLAVRNLGFVLAEQTARYVQVVDRVLEEIQSFSAPLGIRSPEEFDRALGTGAVRALLRDRLRNLPQANAFAIVRADGTLLLSSRADSPAQLDLSDRDFYQHFLQNDDPASFVSAPVRTRTSRTPAVYIARRINTADHALAGIVVGAIDLPYLTEFYRAIDLPEGKAVTLARRDGVVLARYPGETDRLGARIPEGSPWYRFVAAGGGTDRSADALDNAKAVVSVHPLRTWPLVIEVAMKEQQALATWRLQATVIGLAGAGLSAGLAAMFGIIARQFRRKAEQNGQLIEAAAALRASEARVRAFAEMSSDWWWELDADLRLVWISDSPAVRGLRVPDRLGRRPWEAPGADAVAPHWRRLHADMMARRAFHDFRDEETDTGGRLHHLSVTGRPIFDAAGHFAGYRGVVREITAEVDAARQLERAKEQAESASRAKSEFLTNMSHELRTPLNAIIGFSELIRDQSFGAIVPNYVDYASEINAAGRDLLDMINDVLDLSKIEAGRYELADEPVELIMVARACVRMLRPRAEAGSIRINNKMPDMRITVRGDGRAMKQIVLNLLSNAIKFTPERGSVSLHIQPTDRGVALRVTDTGIGIDASALHLLCEPFRQADATISRRFGGSGLGLAICRKLLALHDGTLTIESEAGRGTSVTATFPAERVVEPVWSGWRPMADAMAID